MLTAFDVLILGATPAGIAAARGAVAHGAVAAIIEPTSHVGGILASGLCVTDSRARQNIRGFAGTFYQDLGRHYGYDQPSYGFEPRAAELVFTSYLIHGQISVFLDRHITSIAKNGKTIASVSRLHRRRELLPRH